VDVDRLGNVTISVIAASSYGETHRRDLATLDKG
jgi:hypothetical protein